MSPSKHLANVQIEVVRRMLYIQFGSLQKNIAQQVDFFNRLYFSHVFWGRLWSSARVNSQKNNDLNKNRNFFLLYFIACIQSASVLC